MIVVGLTGLHGSGKGVLATTLVTEHGFCLSSFSGTAKQAALWYNPFVASADAHLADLVTSQGWTRAKEEPAVRQFLNGLGAVLDEIDPQYVLRKAQSFIDLCRIQGAPGVVFDDCYTHGEADLVRRNQGRVVSVLASYEVAQASPSDPFQNSLPTPDATIVNGGKTPMDEVAANLAAGGVR